MSSRVAAARRVRDSAAAGDVRALVTELRAHVGDAMIAERALLALCDLLVGGEELYEDTLRAGGAEAALQALRMHGADANIAYRAIQVLACTIMAADDETLFASGSTADFAPETVAALRRHCDDVNMLRAGCAVICQLCFDSRATSKLWSDAVASDAVAVLSTALRAHLSHEDPTSWLMRALGDLFLNPFAAECGISAGCVELVTAAMRTHFGEGPGCARVHRYGCRLLASICFARSPATLRLEAAGALELVLESLRRFQCSPDVQISGLRALFMYMTSGGGAVESDGFRTDSLQAAVSALRNHGQDTRVLQMAFDVLVAYDVFPLTLEHPCSCIWMLPTLRTPEALALLKRSMQQLELEGKCSPDIPRFVRRVTVGACTGCGKLQENKMKRCSRCEQALYCSVECQHGHWAVHKRECVRPAAAATSTRDA